MSHEKYPYLRMSKRNKEAINGNVRGIVREIEGGHRIFVKAHSSIRSRVGFIVICSSEFLIGVNLIHTGLQL